MNLLEGHGFEFLLYHFYVVYLYPDKVMHAVLYMGFGLLLNATLRHAKNDMTLSRYPAISAVIIGTFYALTDEFHQFFVPYRSPSSMDLLADFLGLLLAQLLILVVTRRRYK